MDALRVEIEHIKMPHTDPTKLCDFRYRFNLTALLAR